MEALRTFLNEIVPGCISSSTSERIAIAPRLRRQPRPFGGHYEISTVYFQPDMTRDQKWQLEATKHMYRQNPVPRSVDHLGHSPWWWLQRLRTFEGKVTVVARFAFFWRSLELEKHYKETETRLDPWDSFGEADRSSHLVVELFERDLQAAGKIAATSFHCNFISGPWH